MIRYNYSANNPPKAGTGFCEFFEDTAGGAKDNQLYYNLSVNDRMFVFVGGGPNNTGNAIYNNTAVDFVYAAIAVQANNTELTVKNNIFWSARPNAHAYTVEPGSALAAFRSAHPALDTHSISVDPLFKTAGSDFHLTAASPCRDSGANVQLGTDFDGGVVPVGSAPDLGAYEYSLPPAPPSRLRIQ